MIARIRSNLLVELQMKMWKRLLRKPAQILSGNVWTLLSETMQIDPNL